MESADVCLEREQASDTSTSSPAGLLTVDPHPDYQFLGSTEDLLTRGDLGDDRLAALEGGNASAFDGIRDRL